MSIWSRIKGNETSWYNFMMSILIICLPPMIGQRQCEAGSEESNWHFPIPILSPHGFLWACRVLCHNECKRSFLKFWDFKNLLHPMPYILKYDTRMKLSWKMSHTDEVKSFPFWCIYLLRACEVAWWMKTPQNSSFQEFPIIKCYLMCSKTNHYI